MKHILVDSNVLLDIFQNDPNWVGWSESTLDRYSLTNILCINQIIYSEVSIGFENIEEFESVLKKSGVTMLKIPKEALFLAGKAFVKYKKNKGNKLSPLPDFFIGAHAEASGIELITRDVSRYRHYFPKVRLICP
jgi:predicted nucleic acid-binding protein